MNPFNLQLNFNRSGKDFTVRNLRPGDEGLLTAFGRSLGIESKELFCPYPWDDPAKLSQAFQAAIDKSIKNTDASYLLLVAGTPVGHFFLWKAGGNPHSAKYGLQIPELGIAVADAYQGQGLGTTLMSILKEAAGALNSDAIELSTALNNDAGWNLYLKSGFEDTGLINIPLEVDSTEALTNPGMAGRLRQEQQMIYILNRPKKTEIMNYLDLKRSIIP